MSHPILVRLRSDDPDERRRACRDAAADPSAVLLADGLVPLLGDPDRGVARAASEGLVEIGRRPGSGDGLDAALRRAMRGEGWRLRWGAAYTLARLGPPDAGLLPALTEAMAAPDGDVRWEAARLLVDLGRVNPGVLPVVLGLARAADEPAVRRMALFALRELAPDDPGAAEALLEASRDARPELARAALTALAALLDPPPAVVERLRTGLEADPDPVVQRLCATSLGELAARNPGRPWDGVREALARVERATEDPALARAASQALARSEAAAHRSADR